MQGWSKVLQKYEYALNQHPIYGAVSPIIRIHKDRHQEVEIGVTPITVTLVTHKQNICFETLYSAVLEVLVPEGRMLPPTDTTMISLNLS